MKLTGNKGVDGNKMFLIVIFFIIVAFSVEALGFLNTSGASLESNNFSIGKFINTGGVLNMVIVALVCVLIVYIILKFVGVVK